MILIDHICPEQITETGPDGQTSTRICGHLTKGTRRDRKRCDACQSRFAREWRHKAYLRQKAKAGKA